MDVVSSHFPFFTALCIGGIRWLDPSPRLLNSLTNGRFLIKMRGKSPLHIMHVCAAFDPGNV